jgi:hypothetical protein
LGLELKAREVTLGLSVCDDAYRRINLGYILHLSSTRQHFESEIEKEGKF